MKVTGWRVHAGHVDGATASGLSAAQPGRRAPHDLREVTSRHREAGVVVVVLRYFIIPAIEEVDKIERSLFTLTMR